MSVLQLRQDLHEIIDTADERVVEAMYAVFQSFTEDSNAIVAFTAAGVPLTKEDFKIPKQP